eukprot:TRINITY_DN1447_c0_g2_i1.p1 TRINITY_DN1447_c0_g2~~TRINITY_DN1447_c0_g2_i1.p1  ORF type:complete len:238 (+),score=35.27 TRINITY_DN1447_c0_g2_i1:161-874(+)
MAMGKISVFATFLCFVFMQDIWGSIIASINLGDLLKEVKSSDKKWLLYGVRPKAKGKDKLLQKLKSISQRLGKDDNIRIGRLDAYNNKEYLKFMAKKENHLIILCYRTKCTKYTGRLENLSGNSLNSLIAQKWEQVSSSPDEPHSCTSTAAAWESREKGSRVVALIRKVIRNCLEGMDHYGLKNISRNIKLAIIVGFFIVIVLVAVWCVMISLGLDEKDNLNDEVESENSETSEKKE